MSLHEEEKSERGREGLRLYFRDLMVAQLVLIEYLDSFKYHTRL